MSKQKFIGQMIEEAESEMAKVRAHFTDYDGAGQDIEDLEAEMKTLRAKLADIEAEEANADDEE